jgi:hypothetical protein
MKTILMTAVFLFSAMSFAAYPDLVCGVEGEELYFTISKLKTQIGKLTLDCVDDGDISRDLKEYFALKYAGPASTVCGAKNSKGDLVQLSVVRTTGGFAGPSIKAYVFVADELKDSVECEKVAVAKPKESSDFE